MTPPPLSSTSTPRRYSSSFISGAISTAASPLQASFNITCRSPIRPSHDVDTKRSIAASKSPYLEPPSFFPLHVRTQGSRVVGEERDAQHDDERTSTLLDEPPTDRTWFLPPPSPGIAVRRSDGGELGVISAINIIVGKTVGVGAYTVPSSIFAGVGSVGMTLSLWVIGSLISFCGLAVYLDLGTAIPRSGGERVYLERIFRRPYMLATCMFMAYVVLLGFSAPNAIVLGEYVLYAVDIAPNRWNVRAIAVATVSGLCYVHARHPKLGLRLINVLGVAKMLILVIVILSGIAGGLMGVGSDRDLLMARRLDVPLSDVAPRSTAQRNFTDIWTGSSTQPYDYATALLKVIYCFRGYSTANQVLSDVKNPVRTLKIAAPIALTLVSVTYLAINIAFFLVVDKDHFRSAGVVVAGIFCRNIFGPGVGAHILPLFVIISAAGNIAASSFAQARVNEELAKDCLLPFAKFWTTTPKPAPVDSKFSTTTSLPLPPSRGLLLHWLISALVIILPPPGRIYNFLVDIGGYPVSVISVAVSVGLLYLHSTPAERWTSPFRASTVAVGIYAASNCLLLILPWIPPRSGRSEDEGFVWFAYPATALGVLGVGGLWWVWWRLKGRGRRTVGGKRRGGWKIQDECERLLEMEGNEDRGEHREGSIPVVITKEVRSQGHM
ncbi:amino acid transporter-like protein [Coniochaeta sp. 2T2.1]|nr:amino acid transporter-like protein [Coniochaeta sp. 2T2.1]